MAPPEAAFGLNRFWVVRKVDFKGLFLRRRRKKRHFKGDFENLGSRFTLILFVKVEKKRSDIDYTMSCENYSRLQ